MAHHSLNQVAPVPIHTSYVQHFCVDNLTVTVRAAREKYYNPGIRHLFRPQQNWKLIFEKHPTPHSRASQKQSSLFADIAKPASSCWLATALPGSVFVAQKATDLLSVLFAEFFLSLVFPCFSLSQESMSQSDGNRIKRSNLGYTTLLENLHWKAFWSILKTCLEKRSDF